MSPSTDNERLSILPAWLVMHAELAANDLGLLTLIALHADRNGSCFPSQGTLASQLKRSRTWVCRRVAFLVSVGILHKIQQPNRQDGGHSTCRYTIVGYAAFMQTLANRNRRGSACADQHSPCAPEAHRKAGSEGFNSLHTPGEPELEPAEPTATLSADWLPSPDDLSHARTIHPGITDAALDQHTRRFIARCLAKGYHYADPNTAWRAWLATDLPKAHTPGQRAQPRPVAAPSLLAAWRRAVENGPEHLQ